MVEFHYSGAPRRRFLNLEFPNLLYFTYTYYMTIVSIVLHVRPNHTRLFRDNSRLRTLHRISKELARGFPGIGVYHSHHSERKGGLFAPHLHLCIDVPDDRLERFLDGLHQDLRVKDASHLFELSPRSSWRTSCEPLHQAATLWAYVLGTGRKHLPPIVYGRV